MRKLTVVIDAGSHSSANNIRILLVEDYQITRTGLRLVIQPMENLEVVGEAADGVSAVSKAMELHPDVILMDLTLPGMNGIEATQAIKEKLPDTKVIMLTSHDRDEDVFAALGAGANGYCLKDIGSEQLAMAIRAVNSGVAWLDRSIAQRVLKASVSSMPVKKPDTECPLSDREVEVLALVVDGLTNQEIANRLFLSADTVKSHMRHIMEKLAVSDRTQAAVKAMRQGFL